MTFLAPAFMIAAAAIAGGVVALHFIVTREPTLVPLPTARFAPERQVRARSRAVRFQDLLLMLLRVLLVLAVGAALARPVLQPSRRPVARVVLVDRSRDVARASEAADSARALVRPGDAIVLFDSRPTAVRDGAADSLGALARSSRPARLTPALVTALRTATEMRTTADSFELAIVSPLAADALDEATDSVRALWPGAVRLVRVAAHVDSATAPVVVLEGLADDPLRLALTSSRNVREHGHTTRIVRRPLVAADSAWARRGDGTLVHWPADSAGTTPRGAGWASRAAPDTAGAVVAGGVVVVAPFARRFDFRAESGDTTARVRARWVDGAPAAVERRLGAGCVRTVSIDVPTTGDLVLQPRFARLVQALAAPCEQDLASAGLLAPSRTSALAAAERARAVPASAIAPPESVPLPLVPWLLGAALVFAVAMLLLGRHTDGRAARPEFA